MLKHNLKPLFIFLLLSAAIIFIARLTDNSCETLRYYRMMGNRELLPGFTGFAIKFVLLIVLTITLVLLRGKQPQRYRGLKMPLAILLPFFIFHGSVMAIPYHIHHRAITASICSKSSMKELPGMKDLSRTEYYFVKQDLWVLPALPQTAAHIDASFWGDEFLGDFWLAVHFQCSSREHTAENSHWHTTNTDTAAGIKYIYYEDGRQ